MVSKTKFQSGYSWRCPLNSFTAVPLLLLLVYRKNAFRAIGGFFCCITMGGHLEKLACRLRGNAITRCYYRSIEKMYAAQLSYLSSGYQSIIFFFFFFFWETRNGNSFCFQHQIMKNQNQIMGSVYLLSVWYFILNKQQENRNNVFFVCLFYFLNKSQ